MSLLVLDSDAAAAAPAEPTPDAAAYALMLESLLPPGQLWQLLGSQLHQLFEGCADELGRLQLRTVDLLNESDPTAALELLPEYEAELDVAGATAIDERRARIIAQIVREQGFRPDDFRQSLALLLGQASSDVVIIERTRSFCLLTNDDREIFVFFIFRDPAIGGTYYLASAQEVVTAMRPEHTDGFVIESARFLSGDGRSLCGRDVMCGSYPITASRAAEVIPGAKLDAGYLFDELDGIAYPVFGVTKLVPGGVLGDITYRAGGMMGSSDSIDSSIAFTGTRRGYFDGQSAFDVGGTDDLVVAWVGMWLALPSSYGTICGKATATFTNGWSVGGSDGTRLEFPLGPGGTLGSQIVGTTPYWIGQPHVGIAVLERATGTACIGTRSFSGGTSIGSISSPGAASFSTLGTAFTVGYGPWVPAGNNFGLSALYIGAGPGRVTAGTVAGLSAVLATFQAAIVAGRSP